MNAKTKTYFLLLCLLAISFNSSQASLGDNLTLGISIPENKTEYVNIFGVEPTDGQLTAIKNSTNLYGADYFTMKSVSDFYRLIAVSNNPIAIVGHNEKGVFYFPSGESLPIQEMTNALVRLGKSAVFLSCNASRYTNYPATSLKINYGDAFRIASSIEAELEKNSLGEVVREKDRPSLPTVSPTLRTSSRSQQTNKCLCCNLSKTSGSKLSTKTSRVSYSNPSRNLSSSIRATSFEKAVNTTINKAEIRKILTSSPAKVVYAAAATGAVVLVVDIIGPDSSDE